MHRLNQWSDTLIIIGHGWHLTWTQVDTISGCQIGIFTKSDFAQLQLDQPSSSTHCNSSCVWSEILNLRLKKPLRSSRRLRLVWTVVRWYHYRSMMMVWRSWLPDISDRSGSEFPSRCLILVPIFLSLKNMASRSSTGETLLEKVAHRVPRQSVQVHQMALSYMEPTSRWSCYHSWRQLGTWKMAHWKSVWNSSRKGWHRKSHNGENTIGNVQTPCFQDCFDIVKWLTELKLNSSFLKLYTCVLYCSYDL